MAKPELNTEKLEVCHQMANRILHAADINVILARGTRMSFHKWGKYGINKGTRDRYLPDAAPWPELEICIEEVKQ